jgi:hypothetical protein
MTGHRMEQVYIFFIEITRPTENSSPEFYPPIHQMKTNELKLKTRHHVNQGTEW